MTHRLSVRLLSIGDGDLIVILKAEISVFLPPSCGKLRNFISNWPLLNKRRCSYTAISNITTCSSIGLVVGLQSIRRVWLVSWNAKLQHSCATPSNCPSFSRTHQL